MFNYFLGRLSDFLLLLMGKPNTFVLQLHVFRFEINKNLEVSP